MFIHTYRKQTLLELGRLLALAGFAVLLLYRPQALATGISRGLAVRSLFPRYIRLWCWRG